MYGIHAAAAFEIATIASGIAPEHQRAIIAGERPVSGHRLAAADRQPVATQARALIGGASAALQALIRRRSEPTRRTPSKASTRIGGVSASHTPRRATRR